MRYHHDHRFNGFFTPSPKGTLNKILNSGNLLWKIRTEIGRFLPNSLINTYFRKNPYSINHYDLASMNHSCVGRFPLCFSSIYIFFEFFWKVVSKMPFSWKNPMKLASLQASVTVAKGKISLATMTPACKGHFPQCNCDWQLQRG